MAILLYGFQAFGNNAKNISEEVMKQIPNYPNLIKHVFPVHFQIDEFVSVAERIKPDIVIGLGQIKRGTKLRLEKTAYNEYGSNKIGIFRPIKVSGTPTINATFDLTNSDLVTVSHNAGRYVCNYSMYVLSEWALKNNAKFCFVHIPKTFPIKRVVEYLCQEIKNQL